MDTPDPKKGKTANPTIVQFRESITQSVYLREILRAQNLVLGHLTNQDGTALFQAALDRSSAAITRISDAYFTDSAPEESQGQNDA